MCSGGDVNSLDMLKVGVSVKDASNYTKEQRGGGVGWGGGKGLFILVWFH